MSLPPPPIPSYTIIPHLPVNSACIFCELPAPLSVNGSCASLATQRDVVGWAGGERLILHAQKDSSRLSQLYCAMWGSVA